MYCPKCGKEIRDDSVFCMFCGEKIHPSEPNFDNPPYSETPANNLNRTINEAEFKNTADQEEDKKGTWIAYTIIAFLIVVAAVIIFSSADTKDYSNPSSSSSSSASSKVQSSVFEKGMDATYLNFKSEAEKYIKANMANPGTAKFTFDRDKFTYDGVVFYQYGTVKFTGKNGDERNDDFCFSFIKSGTSYFVYYLKVGDNVFEDLSSYVDKTGKIISYQATFEGRSYGQYILDNIDDPEQWKLQDILSDPNNDPLMSLSEYYKIKTGMTYEEVIKIVGSYGTESARTETQGYQIVIISWNGNGQIGANATVTFENGRVSSKAQVGLQ